MDKSVEIKAIRISQPIGEFYIGVIKSKDLVDISSADVRSLETELDDYMGIQRKLTKSRVKELQTYVNNEDATFPTSVILAVEEKNAEWNEKDGILKIYSIEGQNYDEIAKIIDGQHRIEGLKNLSPDKEFDINVSIFIGADLATQANIFATVNLAQTKVNRSLVYDLYSYENTRSPQKTCHDIAVALDQYEESPFYNRIKRLGTATPGRDKELLTQAAVVESVIVYISSDPSRDRNTFIKKLFPMKASIEELPKTMFRNLWLEKKDTDIATIIINYFSAVKEKWPHAWDDFDRKGNVLPKTNVFKALMRFLRPVYCDYVADEFGKIPSVQEFQAYFASVDLTDDQFNIETFPPGTSGESGLYKILTQSME